MLRRINHNTETLVPRQQITYKHPRHNEDPFPDPSLLDSVDADQQDEVVTEV